MPSLFGRKKKEGGDEDPNRSSLFGNRKNKDQSTPPAANPYAAPAAGTDPYGAPPPYQGGGSTDRFRSEKSPAVTAPGQGYGGQQRGGGYGSQGRGGGYGAPQSGGGYSAQGGSYGSAGGYGGDRYGSGGGAPIQESRRPGGYGGLGRTNSNDTMSTEAGRNELFGGARERQQQQQQSGGYNSQPSGAYGGSGEQAGGYVAYDQRGELTAEEQEEEDITATKQEIKFMKQQDVASTRNALRLAEQSLDIGSGTLARLAAQGESIYNTEKNLDQSASQNRIAKEKAEELKRVNGSMFSSLAPSNPFTSNSRRVAREAKVVETHQQERAARDASRKAAWDTSARSDLARQQMKTTGQANGGKGTLANRGRYQFEADSEDDDMENEIDSNLDALHVVAKRMNAVGRAMGEEVDAQNTHIERISGKTDKVDDQIALNRARLDRIH